MAGASGQLRAHFRVLLVINGTDVGGTETSLAQLAVGLDRIGHDVQVLSIKSPGRLAARLQEVGIEVSTLGMGEKVTLGNLLSGTWRLSKWLRWREFDVVHSFLPRANIMSRVANRLSCQFPHLSGERSTDHNRSRVVSRLNRWTLPWTHGVLAVSAEVRRILIERDGLIESKIWTVGSGIDLGTIDRQPAVNLRDELGIVPERPILFTAGRLVHDKGHSYLLQAFARVKERGLEADLVIAGDGPEEARLREEVHQLLLGDRVHVLGFRSDVVSIMKASDAFVLPSLEEGIPVTLLEAMACSLPVIASRVGGIPELVVEGRTAILVPPCEMWDRGDGGGERRQETLDVEARRARGIEALSEAIGTILEDAECRRAMGRRGRRRIEEQFSLELMIDRVLEIYKDTNRLVCGSHV